MPSYVDDNFGNYEIRDHEDRAFYRDVQRRSVEKACEGCGRIVRLLKEYAYCNRCAERRERGVDI